MRTKKLLLFILLTIHFLSLSACKQVKTPITKTGIYFDTVISITLYEKNSSELIDECFNIADKYEKLFSKTNPQSDVSRINSSNEEVSVNKETIDVIKKVFEYEELSEGRFSVMCGALIDLWDIANQSGNVSPIIPSDDEIANAITLCGKDKLDIDEINNTIRINTPGAKLDLGAVAKGYIADKMKEYLLSQGVESGIIQLGGNVLLIGNNPTKESGLYSIGISKPFGNDGDVITAVSETDNSIVTSGNYQRYFEYNGKMYHHIIDLTTGYPADTSLNSATVICNSSTEADIMSTVCFLLGKEKGANLISSLPNTSAIFVSCDNEIIYDSTNPSND